LLHYDTQQYALKLAHLKLIINWTNILTNPVLCFDLRYWFSHKIKYVTILAEIKPKLFLYNCEILVTTYSVQNMCNKRGSSFFNVGALTVRSLVKCQTKYKPEVCKTGC